MPHSDSQPCIRPAWLVCVEEMSKASWRTSGSSLRSSARLAISTPCRWCVAMSRENPASTESAVGVAVPSSPPMPRTTASPPPSTTSPTAMTASRAVRTARAGPRSRRGASPGWWSSAWSVGPIGGALVAGRPAGRRGSRGSRSWRPTSGWKSELRVRKSANWTIRSSSALSTFSWWFQDCRLIGRVQARVGGEHPAGLAVDELGERVDVGVGDLVGVVGDPDGAVLEAVHRVLVPDVDVVDGAGAVGPAAVVRSADRRGLGVVDRRGHVLLAGGVVVALDAGDLVDGVDLALVRPR